MDPDDDFFSLRERFFHDPVMQYELTKRLMIQDYDDEFTPLVQDIHDKMESLVERQRAEIKRYHYAVDTYPSLYFQTLPAGGWGTLYRPFAPDELMHYVRNEGLRVWNMIMKKRGVIEDFRSGKRSLEREFELWKTKEIEDRKDYAEKHPGDARDEPAAPYGM